MHTGTGGNSSRVPSALVGLQLMEQAWEVCSRTGVWVCQWAYNGVAPTTLGGFMALTRPEAIGAGIGRIGCRFYDDAKI